MWSLPKKFNSLKPFTNEVFDSSSKEVPKNSVEQNQRVNKHEKNGKIEKKNVSNSPMIKTAMLRALGRRVASYQKNILHHQP